MSNATYEALDDALRAHISDEASTGGIVTDWYVIAAQAVTDTDEDATNYLHVASQSPLHTLHGLVDLAHRRLQQDVDE